MGETIVSFHTSETKRMSKQWIKKGQPGPIRARVHVSPHKADGPHLVHRRQAHQHQEGKEWEVCECCFIVYALAGFLKILKQMRPQVVEEG